MKKLRIATTVTGAHTLPQPEGIVYAPIELAVYLIRGLEKRGHEVTVYAPEGSHVPHGKLITGGLRPLIDDPKTRAIFEDPFTRSHEQSILRSLWDHYLLSEMYKDAQAGKYDVVHVHSPYHAVSFAKMVTEVPTVHTLHDPVYPWRKKIFELFYTKNQHYVAISEAQQRTWASLAKSKVIHNGVDVKNIPPGDGKGDYLLYLGRILPKKGVAEAVKVARKAGERLLIAGLKYPDPYNDNWWDKNIKPYLNSQIRYVGPVWGKERFRYYGQAKALLFPIQWEEPFGMVMIEAMATGTPVIGLNRASVPEVVKHGQTGFVVKTWQDMAAAVKKLDTLDRNACREHVLNNFSLEHMVDEYEKLFLKLAR